jgi:hypothetical protein
VPPRCEALTGFQANDGLWEQLGIPVGLAFLYRNSEVNGVLAVYPSPAGPLEASLPDDAWAAVIADNPGLGTMADDVEALLVNRSRRDAQLYRLSIDRCYELIGLVRTHWAGFTGGPNLWDELDRFFARLRSADS